MKFIAVLDIDARYSDLPEPKGETRPVSVRGCEFMVCVRAKWFAVDENGEGHVFLDEPEWNGEYWMTNGRGYARYVGNFDLEGLPAESALEEIY